jgi:prophage regulatory protein
MRILKTNEVVKIIGLSKVTIWRMERSGTFPQRINLTNRRVGWIESEIFEWLESRPKGICAEPVTQPIS